MLQFSCGRPHPFNFPPPLLLSRRSSIGPFLSDDFHLSWVFSCLSASRKVCEKENLRKLSTTGTKNSTTHPLPGASGVDPISIELGSASPQPSSGGRPTTPPWFAREQDRAPSQRKPRRSGAWRTRGQWMAQCRPAATRAQCHRSASRSAIVWTIRSVVEASYR